MATVLQRSTIAIPSWVVFLDARHHGSKIVQVVQPNSACFSPSTSSRRNSIIRRVGHRTVRYSSCTAQQQQQHQQQQRQNLQLYNSLTGNKEPILSIPNNDNSKNKTPARKGIACYTCGPTVYAPSHLGHARTYVWLDILRRTLEHTNQQQHDMVQPTTTTPPPLFVMNITDVDDKILAAATCTNNAPNNKSFATPLELARHFEAEFWRDWDALHCLRPHVVTRVSEYVDSHIVPYIQRLVDSGMAYEIHTDTTSNNDNDDESGIYFDTRAYEKHCKLRYGNAFHDNDNENINTTDEEDGIRETTPSTSSTTTTIKRNTRDFALWKRRKPSETLYWASPWGPGRPGWHIECSALLDAVRQQFADSHSFALHAGGVDLQFPHHTNEIAQANAYRYKPDPQHNPTKQRCGCRTVVGAASSNGNSNNNNNNAQPWIPHWVHTGQLRIDGLKMSKSLKNFISVQDWLDEATASTTASSTDNDESANRRYSRAAAADDFRLWCLGLSGSYRKTATFSPKRMQEARHVREKIAQYLMRAEEWLSRRRQPNDDKDSSSPLRDSKKYRPKDHALLTIVHDAARVGRRAMVEMDLDGTTFLKQLVRIAEAGTAHLQQQQLQQAGSGPTEPVQASLDVLREMLRQVGFSDVTCRAGILANELNDGTATENGLKDEASELHQSTLHRALLDELTHFRSVVRRAALGDLEQKTHDFEGNLSFSENNGADPASARKQPLNHCILQACDDLRNKLPAMGVELLDASVEDKNSVDDWRLCLRRPTSAPKDADKQEKNAANSKEQMPPSPVFDKRSVAPQDLFRADPRYIGMFLEFDEDGIPVRNADGSEVSKKQQKKFRKKRARHVKLFEEEKEK